MSDNNNEAWMPTAQIKWENKIVPWGPDPEVGKTIQVLMQLWVSSTGEAKWCQVPNLSTNANETVS